MFEFKVISVPTIFVTLGEIQVKAKNLMRLLEEFYDDDYINDYNLDTTIAEALVIEGILEKCDGERMAKLFRKTDKFEDFYKSYSDEYYKLEE